MGKSTLKVKRTRKYLGTMPKDGSREDRSFNKAHLKAYLKGRSSFYHGFFTNSLGERQRTVHLVQQEVGDLETTK